MNALMSFLKAVLWTPIIIFLVLISFAGLPLFLFLVIWAVLYQREIMREELGLSYRGSQKVRVVNKGAAPGCKVVPLNPDQ